VKPEGGLRKILDTIAVWLALARSKRDYLMLGAFLVFMALATLIWNIIP
jgi:hypothetical protein